MWESEAKKLKENVRYTIFNNSGAVGVLYRLEMIDNLCRMGLSYHFEEEIKNFLGGIAMSKSSLGSDQEDLHAVSLYFRLLRQYGYKISQGIPMDQHMRPIMPLAILTMDAEYVGNAANA
ncbi:hypothetical protein IFM89_033630 [Coptis chinensis]|uniref:Terpene synthase N-terminal domain-containing protein n=1 Tax=Coptis chinensis TaxID=261450 RepID=A0A835HRP3_9MAGN|nr:hypothetical protein IFM89_033630 [Coptis chinensis]